MSISKDRIKEIICAFIISMLAIANASPRVLLSGYQRLLYFLLLFVCMVGALYRVMSGIKIKKDYLLRIVVVCLMFLGPLLLGQMVYANRYLHLSGLLLYPILYDATKNTRIPFYVVRLLAVWSVFVAIPTIIVCSQAAYASRQADVSVLYQSMGVGSYMFIYALTLASVVLFSYIINNVKRNHTKWLCVLWLIYIITIYKSNFMTAVLISIVGAILCLICKKSSSKTRLMSVLLMVPILFLFLGPILNGVERTVLLLIPEAGRIAQIFNSSTGIVQAVTNEFIIDRLPTMQKSLSAVTSNPLFGIIFSSNSLSFGQHSTFLDTYALWGIPISCLYFYLVFKPFLMKGRRSKFEITIPVYIAFLLLLVFNNIECTSAFVMCYITLFFIDQRIEGNIRE